MNIFPQAPIFIGRIDSKPDEYDRFRSDLQQNMGSASNLRRVAELYPHRVCHNIGNQGYKAGLFNSAPSSLYQNPVFDEMCCGVKYEVGSNGRVGVTFARGGEYLLPDPEQNALMMVWCNFAEKRIEYMMGLNGAARFVAPKLLPSTQAEEFFTAQHRAAGCSASDIKAVRRGTTRIAQFDTFRL